MPRDYFQISSTSAPAQTPDPLSTRLAQVLHRLQVIGDTVQIALGLIGYDGDNGMLCKDPATAPKEVSPCHQSVTAISDVLDQLERMANTLRSRV